MSLERTLNKRSNATCEICGAIEHLEVYTVQPAQKAEEKNSIYACKTCTEQIENPDTMDANHWRCLNDSMWSEQKAVQIMAWRMLNRLKAEGWPKDLLDMMYLEEDELIWAKEGIDDENTILAGHGRWNVAKKMSLEQVPCMVISHLNDTQKRAYVIADNKIDVIIGSSMGGALGFLLSSNFLQKPL